MVEKVRKAQKEPEYKMDLDIVNQNSALKRMAKGRLLAADKFINEKSSDDSIMLVEINDNIIEIPVIQLPFLEKLLEGKSAYYFNRSGQVYDEEPTFTCEEIKNGRFSGKNKLYNSDNLTFLIDQLQKGETYDVIYIDPPYNIGLNNKKYRDNYDDYLSMMEARLEVAWELLASDGMFAISIDKAEFARVKALCDDLFGSESYRAILHWKKSTGIANSKTFRNTIEYCLVYGKNGFEEFTKTKDVGERQFKYEDEDGKRYRLYSLQYPAHKYKEKFDYPFHFNGQEYRPDVGCSWNISKETMQLKQEKSLLTVEAGKLQFKQYRHESKSAISDFFDEAMTRTGIADLRAIKGLEAVNFRYMKPVSYIQHILKLYPKKDARVLDFFAGTGTTGQAVLKLNKEDGGNRAYILCTQDEEDNPICSEICKKRLTMLTKGWKIDDQAKLKGKVAIQPGIGGGFGYYTLASLGETREYYESRNNLLYK